MTTPVPAFRPAPPLATPAPLTASPAPTAGARLALGNAPSPTRTEPAEPSSRHPLGQLDDGLVPPHGGRLVERFLRPQDVRALVEHAASLPAVFLDARERGDLELLATGAASPLAGFLGAADHASVLERLRLADGTVWPLPLTLAVDIGSRSPEERERLAPGGEVALRDPRGVLLGVLRIAERFERDALAEARAIHGTADPTHPGVRYLLARPRTLLGGPVVALPLPETLPFAEHRYTPRELRQEIRRRGWRHVAALHLTAAAEEADLEVVLDALASAGGVVVHPPAAAEDETAAAAAARFRTYEDLVGRRLPRKRVVLAAFPAVRRHAGAREALLDALVRKSYGIDGVIVPAAGAERHGYGPAAWDLFSRFAAGELATSLLRLETAS